MPRSREEANPASRAISGNPNHRIGTATNRDSPLLPHHSIDLTQHDIRHSHVQLDSIHHH